MPYVSHHLWDFGAPLDAPADIWNRIQNFSSSNFKIEELICLKYLGKETTAQARQVPQETFNWALELFKLIKSLCFPWDIIAKVLSLWIAGRQIQELQLYQPAEECRTLCHPL